MLKSVLISVYILITLSTSALAQGSDKIFVFAYITMSDDLTIFTDIQEVSNISGKDAVNLFKVNNGNLFVNFLINRTDVNYSPKYKADSGVQIEITEDLSEANRIYQDKRKDSGKNHYGIEGFKFMDPKSASKTGLIRN